MQRKVLIIDDEERLRTLLSRIIGLEGYEVSHAADLKTGLRKLGAEDIDVVVCDVKLPDGNGVDFIKVVKDKYPVIEIILLTAYGNIEDGVQAIKNGAFDYITKGNDNNKIIPLLSKAIEKVILAKRVQQLEKQLEKKYSFDSIIGRSKAIKTAIDAAQKVARTDTTVLLTGETGSGKEVFAQAIHNASSRNKEHFIPINCAAFSKDLLESELFGHTAGSFTNAIKDTKGIFEEANNGTVFLDEVGEMPVNLQAKLLRVLESGEFLKIGENKPRKTNVRIIAATNRDLQKETSQNGFREDLFYRLSVFHIELPPLRNRVEDIEALANYFVRIYTLKTAKKIDGISADYIEALKKHRWNGNIRELKNIIERSIILTESGTVDIESLPDELRQGAYQNDKIFSAFSMASVERLQIQKVLNHTKGNKAEAARLLEIGIATLYRKIEEYKL
jgi:DNA-binding NtrC family response regulator